MFWSDLGRNKQVDGIRAAIAACSMHTAYGGTTGLNEATGGSYARIAPTVPAASAGQASNSALAEFNLAAGTYLFMGFWDATPGWLGCTPLGGYRMRAVTYSTSGNFFGEASHGLTAGKLVVAYDVYNTGLPTGMVEGAIYYVINPSTDQFQLSLTSGGAAIAPTSTTVLALKQVEPLIIPGGGGKGSFDISKFLIDGTLT